ncbi:MAG TPA: DUF885 domain-containing protein [Gemmatimonadales bacterium]|jgi:uncharacterized protein (DUF885 family)|nr:DUF885 domain-containing protein [Gemmatimonadales bacterium]
MRRRDFLSRTAQSAAAFGILRHLGACRLSGGAGGSGSFASIRDRYFVQFLQLNPVVSTYLGGDGYSPSLAAINGKLRDYRPEALDAERAFYRGVREDMSRVSRNGLPAGERIDYDVVQAQLAFLLHQVEDLRQYERAIDTYVAEPFRGVDWQIQQMQEFPGGLRGTADEWELVVSRLAAVPAYVRAAQSNLQAGKQRGNLPDWRLVRRDGIEGSRANLEYFRSTIPTTAAKYLGARPFVRTLEAELQKAANGAASAYSALGEFLGRTYGNDVTNRFAIGEDEYEWRLRHCLNVSRKASELFEYGAEQVALYQSKIQAVAQEVAGEAKLGLSFGTQADGLGSVRKAMDHLSADSPRNDDELFRWYREVGERAVAYGRQQHLFDIPDTYRLDVVPTPPVLRSTIDAAYYPAPPFKRSGVGRFYLTPTGNDPGTLRLNNRASVADTAVHEGFPGHDWHYKFMTQHASEISNIRWLTPGSVEDSSSMWEDSMAAEGWALYSEELMGEPAPGRPHGFYTPAEHLYELQGQLLRAVRVRVDVGIHTGRMTFDEGIDYFTENVSFMPKACAKPGSDSSARAICDGAQRALYRYSKWPTQAITYNLGKNAIVELREAYRRQKGSAFSAKQFHEKLMGMGTIPAGYFRELFLQQD